MQPVAQMALFARVVDAGSFAAAARALGQTRAAVSQQIADLEAHVGARLLQRTTRRMSLTEAGAAFLEHCRRIAEEADEAERVVAALQGAPRGNLRVAAPQAFGARHLVPLVPDFLAAHPAVRLDLELGDAFVDLVRDRFDLVLRIRRPADSSLTVRRLSTIHRVFCAAPAYLARRGVPQRPRDLAAHDCLVYAGSDSPETWRFAEGSTVRVRGPLRSNDGDVLRAAALAGAGIAHLPTFLVGEDLLAGRLRRVLPQELDDSLCLHALFGPRPRLAPKVRAFLDFLDTRLCRTPPWDAFLAQERSRSTRRPT